MEEIKKMKGNAVALCSEIKSGFAHIKKNGPAHTFINNSQPGALARAYAVY